jgi:hypothetical protein
MTKDEWQACTTAGRLGDQLNYSFGSRKLRLFASACLRRVWDLLAHDGTWLAVEVNEQFADGLASVRDAMDVFMKAEAETGDCLWMGDGYYDCPCCNPIHGTDADLEPGGAIFAGVQRALTTPAWTAARAAFHARALAAWNAPAPERERAIQEEQAAQHALLCDLTDKHPWRDRPEPAWLWRNGATVHKMARVIYDRRAFDRLPFLSDALEDAGCSDTEILDHCRRPGPHARGCWVLDFLLEKDEPARRLPPPPRPR